MNATSQIHHQRVGARLPLAGLILWAAGVSTLWAQLPVARLSTLVPPGGQIGTSFELTVAGSELEEPGPLYFSHAGITGLPKSGATKFTVAIASHVPPGVYEARFVGRFGISNPRAFVVGALPESVALPTNGTAPSAIELKPDTTINGRVSPNAVAWFKLTAQKAQRFLIECLAESIDSRMDAALVLTDATGHELERNRQGGLLDFSAPTEGVYWLSVSDVLYRGGDDYFYRLTLSTGPRVDFILPPAGLAGSQSRYTLYGRNLPGGQAVQGMTIDGKPLEQFAVEIALPAEEGARCRLDTGLLLRPAEAVVNGIEYRLQTDRGLANPVLLSFATAAVVLEQEPNNKPSQAQKVTPPCEVSGQFYPANEQDWFTFDAKKGEVWWIEVFSQRLGLPTDPFVFIQRVTKNKGEEQTSDVQELYDTDTNIGDREFNTVTRDPSGRFEAKEEGTYRLQVRDLFSGLKASPRHVYRLSIRRETPDFRLVAQVLSPKFKADAKDIPIGVPLLRRGESLPIRVMAFRRDGFSGDIQLSVENPPPGLRFDGDRIESGKNSAFVLMAAAADAPAFAGPIKLIGQAKVGDSELVREARGGSMIFPVGNLDSERPESRSTREFTLAISGQERAPIAITPAESKVWEATAKTKLEIPLRITRHGEFNANLKLKPLGPGAAEALKEFEVDGKATNATLTLDLAALKLTPGTHVFSVQSQTTGKYRNNPEAAALAEAAAKEADKAAADLAEAAKKAKADLENAAKVAAETAGAAKDGAEKLAAAKAELEKAPADEKLTAARDTAEKAATEAAAQAKSAMESKVAAEKAETEAAAKAKEAQAKKEVAAARAKEATEKAKSRDVSLMVYSAPIRVKVTAVEQVKSK